MGTGYMYSISLISREKHPSSSYTGSTLFLAGWGVSRVKSHLAADNHDAIQPTSPQFVNLESAVVGKTKTIQRINQHQRLPEVGNGLWLFDGAVVIFLSWIRTMARLATGKKKTGPWGSELGTYLFIK